MAHRARFGTTACALLLLALGAAHSGEAESNATQEWRSVQVSDDEDARAAWWSALTSDELQRFLAAGVNINLADRRGWSPLHSAARFSDHPAVLRALLDAGADLHARDRAGDTALHWAAADNPSVEILSLLIDAGAKVNARDRFGWAPIHTAAESSSNPLVIERLLDAGAKHKRRVYFILWRPTFLARRNSNLDASQREAVVAMLKVRD